MPNIVCKNCGMPVSIEEIEEIMPEKIQSRTGEQLGVIYWKNFLGALLPISSACMMTRSLAKNFHEKKRLQILDKLVKYTYSNHPLSTIEYVYYRDRNMGYRMNHIYNYGYLCKPISLKEIVENANNCFATIHDIFFDICIKHDVEIPLMPTMMMPEQQGGLR